MQKYYFVLSLLTSAASLAASIALSSPYFLAFFLLAGYFAYKDSQYVRAREEAEQERRKSVHRTEYYRPRPSSVVYKPSPNATASQRDDSFVVLPYQDPSWTSSTSSDDDRYKSQSTSSSSSWESTFDSSSSYSSGSCDSSSSSDSSSCSFD